MISSSTHFTPRSFCSLQPFSKLRARFRHLTSSRLCSSPPSVSNQIVRSKTLLISSTRENYRTSSVWHERCQEGFARQPMVIVEVTVLGFLVKTVVRGPEE